MFDNALLLRYVENWGRISRVLGCLKTRVGKVALALGEFRITPQGLRVNKDPLKISGFFSGIDAVPMNKRSAQDRYFFRRKTDYELMAEFLRTPGFAEVLPLKVGEKTVETLSVQSYRPQAYVLEDKLLLEMLTPYVAAALENACLICELGESMERYRRLAENAQDVIYRYRLHPSSGFE